MHPSGCVAKDAGDKISWRIDSGATMHFVSAIWLLAPWNPNKPNITFSAAAGGNITSEAGQAVLACTRRKRPCVCGRSRRHLLRSATAAQSDFGLTKRPDNLLRQPDFDNCPWTDNEGNTYVVSCVGCEFVWNLFLYLMMVSQGRTSTPPLPQTRKMTASTCLFKECDMFLKMNNI